VKLSLLQSTEQPYQFITNHKQFKRDYQSEATQRQLEQITNKKVVRLRFSLGAEDLLLDYNE
jgi:hypothetical protein